MLNNKIDYLKQTHTLSHDFTKNKAHIDVLRLDKFHPVVSGNKWFKLRYYLEDAIQQNKNTIITFGGAFSNHIVATAYACKLYNLKSIGVIRGNEFEQLSHTLLQAKEYGMELHFVDRNEYKNKQVPTAIDSTKAYIISEGGYGKLGARGAATILEKIDITRYTHIICAMGTGTTLAGLVQSSLQHQKVIGINVLKGYEDIGQDVSNILDENCRNIFINNNYHFNGYAKKNDVLINFMNQLWLNENLPTDFVYTAKLLYAVNDLLHNNYFNVNDRLLVIHSGGLQGNLSLPINTLLF